MVPCSWLLLSWTKQYSATHQSGSASRAGKRERTARSVKEDGKGSGRTPVMLLCSNSRSCTLGLINRSEGSAVNWFLEARLRCGAKCAVSAALQHDRCAQAECTRLRHALFNCRSDVRGGTGEAIVV